MDQRTRELASYAAGLDYGELTAEAIHECKRRVIDTVAEAGS
jgi:2-methylcitrate dehydratase PrpD